MKWCVAIVGGFVFLNYSLDLAPSQFVAEIAPSTCRVVIVERIAAFL